MTESIRKVKKKKLFPVFSVCLVDKKMCGLQPKEQRAKKNKKKRTSIRPSHCFQILHWSVIILLKLPKGVLPKYTISVQDGNPKKRHVLVHNTKKIYAEITKEP